MMKKQGAAPIFGRLRMIFCSEMQKKLKNM